MINFSDLPNRIYTYGNSFTQYLQVSKGDTWQEVLAANFGAPIRPSGNHFFVFSLKDALVDRR
jgi:hypothetical protein